MNIQFPIPGWEYNRMQRDLILSPSQIEDVRDEQGSIAGRFRLGTLVMCCGRSAGKSYGVMRAAIKDALLVAQYKQAHPERYRSCRPLVSVAIAAPTSGHFEENWKVLLTILQETADYHELPPRSLYGIRRQDKKWWLFEEYFIDIQFLSLFEPNAVRSMNIDVLVVDEAAFIERDEEFWGAIKGCLYREATIPRLYVCSSPNGRANRFYQLWKSAGGQETIKHAKNKAQVWMHPQAIAKAYHFTSYDNERNSANFDQFDKEAEQNRAQYNAERLAEFSDSVSGERVLGDWAAYAIDEVDWKPTDPVTIGVDCSMMGEDESVITVVDPVWRVPIYIERGSKWDAQTHLEKIRNVVDRFPGYRSIEIDANGPAGSWWSMLRTEGFRVTPSFWSNKDKLRIFQTIKTQLDIGKVKVLDPYKASMKNMPQGEELREHLKTFLRQWEDTLIQKHNAGYYKIGHTGARHDDLICSWVLAVYPWFGPRAGQLVERDTNPAQEVSRSIFAGLL